MIYDLLIANVKPGMGSQQIAKCLFVGALIFVLISQSTECLAQGSLSPSGSPAPTMKSLDQLDAKLEKRTPITALPFNITTSGSFYLTTTLTGQPGTNGITISADNVTIDLNGFSIVGVGGSLNGIQVIGLNGHRNLAIHNGSVCQWGNDGIDVSDADNGEYKDLRVSQNGAHGLFIGAQSLLLNCIVQSNSSSGIRAGAGSQVLSCIASVNGTAGIENYRFNSDNAVTLIKGCGAHGNIGSGIQGNANIIDNQCVGNTGSGILLNGTAGRVEGNYVRLNAYGIFSTVSSSTNVVIRNFAIGNTNAYSISGSGNIVGPIINAAGVAANNNPNANFSF